MWHRLSGIVVKDFFGTNIYPPVWQIVSWVLLAKQKIYPPLALGGCWFHTVHAGEHKHIEKAYTHKLTHKHTSVSSLLSPEKVRRTGCAVVTIVTWVNTRAIVVHPHHLGLTSLKGWFSACTQRHTCTCVHTQSHTLFSYTHAAVSLGLTDPSICHHFHIPEQR